MVNGDNQWLVKKTTPPPPSPQKRTTLRPEVIKNKKKGLKKGRLQQRKFRSATVKTSTLPPTQLVPEPTMTISIIRFSKCTEDAAADAVKKVSPLVSW